MKQLTPLTVTLGLVAALTSTPVVAQPSKTGPTVPQLHVNDAHGSCFFDLHPELTQAEFQEFTAELGSVLRFRQLGDVAPLGKGHFDIGVQYARTPINDAKGAWNNTMSHPAADHYLGQAIEFPRIVARLGVSDRVDIGAWGGLNPRSNYGTVGLDAKIALITQGPRRPVSLAIRPSLSSLVGPDEVWVGNTAVDVSLSRAFGSWSAYVGLGASASLGVERSKDVDLDEATAESSLAYAGISYRWRALVLSAEAESGDLPSYGFRVSTRF